MKRIAWRHVLQKKWFHTNSLAAMEPTERVVHGVRVTDPFRWLETPSELGSAFIAQQKNASEAYFANDRVATHAHNFLMQLQAKQAADATASGVSQHPLVIQLHDHGIMCNEIPVVDGSCLFYHRADEHGSGFYRFSMTMHKEELLLHSELLQSLLHAPTQSSMSVPSVRVSACERYVGLLVGVDGADASELFLVDTKEALTSNVRVRRSMSYVRSFTWGQTKNNTPVLFLCVSETADDPRPCEVYCMQFEDGNIAKRTQTELLHQSRDTAHAVEVSGTKDKRYVLLNETTKTENCIYIFDTINAYEEPPLIVHPLEHGLLYAVEHANGRWFVFHNGDDANFTVDEIKNLHSDGYQGLTNARTDYRFTHMNLRDVDDVRTLYWEPLPRAAAKRTENVENVSILDEVDVFDNHIVLYRRENGHPEVEILTIPTKKVQHTRDEEASSSRAADVDDDMSDMYQSTIIASSSRFGSITPSSNLLSTSSQCDFLHSDPALGEYLCSVDLNTGNIQSYALSSPMEQELMCSQILCPSEDGVDIPVTLLHTKTAVHPETGLFVSPSKLILSGYGCYGAPNTPTYAAEHEVWIQSGYILAWAHVRGGGEYGAQWHEAAMLRKKETSIVDYLCVSRHLCELGVTSPEMLCAQGASAGAIVIANALTRAPSLYAAAMVDGGYFDVLTTLLDPSLPYSMHEYAEFGDPRAGKRNLRSIMNICPYQTLLKANSPRTWPHMLLSHNVNDDRVPVSHTLKYAALLQHKLADHKHDNVIIVDINETGGHEVTPPERQHAFLHAVL